MPACLKQAEVGGGIKKKEFNPINLF